MKKYKDLLTGLVCIALALFYIINALSIKVFRGAGATPIDSRSIPLLWGACMLLLGLVLATRGIKNLKLSSSEEEIEKLAAMEWLKQNYAIPGTLLLLAVYAIAMKEVGFILTTVFYLICQIWLVTPKEKKNLPLTLMIGIGFAVSIYLLFVKALNVPLPAGWLGL